MAREIPFKEWKISTAARLKIGMSVLNRKIYKDKEIPYPTVRRVNKRVIFVIDVS